MSRPQRADALAEAFAVAMRDAWKQWQREHGNGRDHDDLWANDCTQMNVNAHYTPQHRGVCVVEIISRRPGRNEAYPYELRADGGPARLLRSPEGR